MEKENLIPNIDINDYGFYDECYGTSNIFNTLWEAREYFQKEMMQQDEMRLKSWALKENEELKKDNVEVLSEKGKLIFKGEINERECGGIFNYYFGNRDDIYKKIGLSFSKKSIVLFHEWKNINEVVQKRTRGISIDETLDQKIERMADETAIEVKIGSDEYEMETCFSKKMQLYFRNVKTNEWFYHEFGKIKRNTEIIKICQDCIKILKMLKSKTVSDFEKKRLSKLIKSIEENFSNGRIIRYSFPKNKISAKETKNK